MTSPILTISDRGGGDGIIVDHANVSCSWVLSNPGSASVTLSARDARHLGAHSDNWAGAKWLSLTRHPDLPDWGGVITAPRWTVGRFESVAESFHVLLRKRRVNRTYGQQSAPAGALARRAFTDVQTDDDMLLLWAGADEAGEVIDYQWRGGQLDAIFRELIQASGQEYTVDASRLVSWRVRLGSDKTGSVLLSREIVDHDYTADLWTVANDLEGIAADTKFADSAHDQIDSSASIKQRGRYQETLRYTKVVSKGTLRPKLKADLTRLKDPTQVVTLRTVNLNHSWGRYHLGDSITVVLADVGVVAEVRIEARSIDFMIGIETLGTVVEATVGTPRIVPAYDSWMWGRSRYGAAAWA